jgi:hypothetical protein
LLQFKAEHATVKVERTLQMRNLEVHVPNANA